MPESINIYSFLAQSAEKFADHIAVSDSEGRLTYRELHIQAEKLRRALEKLQLTHPGRLAIRFANDRHFLIALFAGVGAGFTVMPIFHELTHAEQHEQLHAGKINYLLAHDGVHPVLDTPYALTLLQHEKDEESQLLCSDPAFIRFTSGTTGQSKGVLISHSAVAERIQGAQQALQLTEKDTVVWVLPMAYHFVVSLVLYVRQGCHIAVINRLDANTLQRVVEAERGTVLYASPVHLKLLATATETQQLPSLRMALSTTTAISASTCHKFETLYGIAVTQAYGIIEIGLPLMNTTNAHHLPDSVGKPLKGYEVGILDEFGQEVPCGHEGNLALRGPGMFSGYLNPVKKLVDVLENGWFMTGDLALKDTFGNVRVVGRKKSVINVGGNKVFPEEVEFVLENHTAVKHARVYSDNHPLIGEVVAAEIVLNQPCEAEQLIHHCRKQLTAFKVPQRMRFVETIAHTRTGKIKR